MRNGVKDGLGNCHKADKQGTLYRFFCSNTVHGQEAFGSNGYGHLFIVIWMAT